MAGELAGQVAIVTGAGRGFGRSIAAALAAEGAAVALVARSAGQLGEVAARLHAGGGRALALAGDVTDPEDVANAVRLAEERLGPVSILVNNAGVAGPFGPVGTFDPEEWWAAQQVHIRAPMLFMSAVLPGMKARRRGHIINVAAIAGTVVAPNMSAYCVGKCAAIRLTEHVAAEGRDHGIAAFAIEPGTVVTTLADQTMAAADAQQWVPGMVERLKQLKAEQDPAVGLAKCGRMVADLASGRYDALSGRYLDVRNDLDDTLRQASAK